MRLLIQRVKRASVRVNSETISAIDKGLLILVGIGNEDQEMHVKHLAEKVAGLRIFEDQEGKTNLSIKETFGKILVVSQFTLYANTSKGRRPSFTDAADPQVAEHLVGRFAELLSEHGIPVYTGVFGANMEVELLNDGPMTIWIENP